MTLHPEVMPEPQQRLLRALGPRATARGFYLGGGTAVALYEGHRRSVDLDWFSGAPMGDPLRLAAGLVEDGIELEVESVDVGTLHGHVEGVRVSFLEYRYPLLQSLVDWPAYGCRLASREDLLCMKLAAIAGRGARKDFLDVYALGISGLPPSKGLDLYREKYATSDVGHVLFSLAYFDDAEGEAMPEVLGGEDWAEVRRTIEGWVLEIARREP